MHLEGTHTLNAPVDTVYRLLLDPDVLARVTPGVQSLESRGNDEFDAAFGVKMGPVNGTFKGSMAVVDKVAGESFKLKMKMNGKIGNVAAEGQIKLSPADGNNTLVNFAGDAKLSGTLARTGQRVMSGVAKTMTNQFFKALEDEIEALTPAKAAGGGGLWARIKAFFARLFGKK